MSTRLCLRAVAAFLAALSLAGTAFADGVPVMPWFSGGQHRPGLAADGAGGAWLAFKTDAGTAGIVRLAPTGLVDVAWPGGIFDTGLTLQLDSPARVLANLANRVYVISDYGVYDELVTGYDAAGDTVEGFPTSAQYFYPGPGAVLGADGRVLIGMGAAFDFTSSGVRFAIVGPDGQMITEQEVPTNYRVNNTDPSAVVSDGTGGMYIAMPIFATEDNSTLFDVGLQRIAGDGTRPWGNGGMIVIAALADQREIRMWPDGAGGALISWSDSRTNPASSPRDIYATRFASTGLRVTGWTALGTRVASATGAQTASRIVDDGAGGAWILWRDERVPDIDLYFTHVTGASTFAPGFTSAGTLLCGATGSASDPQMVPDGAGGFFAAWIDPRDGEVDLYGTHITSAGTPAAGWPANGLALCDDPAFQAHPAIVSTGVGQAIVAWRDSRISPPRVYALALADDGPVTTGVTPGPAAALRLRAVTNPSFGLSDMWVAAPAGEWVDVRLLDVVGRAVRGLSIAGTGAETRARFAGGPLPAGIYFATARSGAHRATLRLCVLN